jgi:hypothetical protein
MAKITARKNERIEMKVKTKPDSQKSPSAHNWWDASSKKELSAQLMDTAAFLKEQQQYRFRQASIHARMYGNLSLMNYAGSSLNKLSPTNNLPVDRPTMNVVQSCVDTLVSRLAQSRPRPVFLTDNSDYKQRRLSKQLNQFINGEFYQTESYEMGKKALKDAAILGDGVLKIIETDDNKVGLERVLPTELFVDANDAFHGNPRTLYQIKLVDRSVLKALFPEEKNKIDSAEQAFPDNAPDTQKTASDQVMVVEAWHLPSSKTAGDGRHVIATTNGIIDDEQYKKNYFPFEFMHYSRRLTGLWSQGLSEQLAGTQIEINKILVTISKSISLVGVPRVFVEDGSKVVKAHLNDNIGAIVTYRGTKPQYEVAPCVPQEMYAQLQRLIEYAYQQSGVSALAATSQKPAGLNSGEAIRNYDDLQSDRFAELSQRYSDFYRKLAIKMFEKACEIAERDGKYQTIYPDKDGSREIDLPAIKELTDNPFVIQCYDSSSLPRDPAGRLAKVAEMMQAGLIAPDEGRRLLGFPDLEQVDRLAIAAEERILKQLDDIVESGKYSPPDPYTDIAKAIQLVTQYYNLYTSCGLEESKASMLRNYHQQLLALQQAAMPPQPMDAGMPLAEPQAPPVSDLLPTMPQ